MDTTAMGDCSLHSLVVTPTGGGRPGARSPATVGPEEDRDQGGPSLPSSLRETDRGHARSTARGGRRRQAYAKPFGSSECLRPPPARPPEAGPNPPGGTPPED